MRWLIDAQLPKRLALALNQRGHIATHTLDLPNGNATTDLQVHEFATRNQAIVVSKDYDFVNYFHLNGRPRLLLVSTGNISNNQLLGLILKQIQNLENGFAIFDFIEINQTQLIYHA
jgi:predicted nuclease of predicted toxin-antitoxin system